MTRTVRLLAVLLLVGVGLTVATGGFEAGSTDRETTVGIADDDAAMVAIDVAEPTATDDATVALVNVANGQDAPVTLQASVDDEGEGAVESVEASRTLAPGETWTVHATVDCESSTGETVTVRIVASGEGFTSVITRDVTVTCSDGE